MIRTGSLLCLTLLSLLAVVPLLVTGCTGGAPADVQAQVRKLEAEKSALQGELDKLKGAVKVREFKMQSLNPPGSPDAQSFEEYAAEVIRRQTNGEISIKLFPGDGLVPAALQFDAVKNGTIHFGVASSSRDAGKVGPAGEIILGMPFMWKSIDEGESLFYDFGIGEIARSLYAPNNIHVIAPSGSMGLNVTFLSRVPIRTLADFKGKRLRISGGRPAGDLFAKFGASSVATAQGEVYTNLATRVIDGASAGLPSMVSLAWHEVAKYLIQPPYTDNYNALLIANTDTWKSLTDKQRQIIEVAFLNWQRRAYVLGRNEVATAQEALQKQGVETIRLPEADVKELTRSMQEIWDKTAGDNPAAKQALQLTKNFLRSRGYID